MELYKMPREEKLEDLRRKYVFGEIIQWHCIGDYQIAEVINNKNEKFYHGYINYKDTHKSYDALDEALVGCIGCKYDGVGSKAGYYFCKMIGMRGME